MLLYRRRIRENGKWMVLLLHSEILIHEGKNRQVRRMFKAIGHPVLELSRTGLGDLTIGKLAVGQCRKLSPAEVEYLKRV